ncbi:hypothetical protein [Fimbriimonas ginsengisoli]|uniref:Uncharacterized protein n=1 Tax=Fimbriimonas ginsengisoli Gsoil 348 TaxID=661478 RepID=A0A068NNY4_FIMGI|nr:hypothetical protein [Fimbriimonas ginsengisoli]AIE85146.1 hypothetical protein OP10G_1778 [Fimbriimonas ginsengisoli Gsoil 348]
MGGFLHELAGMKRQDLFGLGCVFLLSGIVCGLAQPAAAVLGVVPGIFLLLLSLRTPRPPKGVDSDRPGWR